MPRRIRPAPTLLLLTATVWATAACRPLGDGPKEDPPVAEGEAAVEDTVPAIQATNVTWYYRDLEAAQAFYSETMGFETVAELETSRVLRVAGSSYLTLAEESAAGPVSVEAPRSVTLTLVTDEVEGWWDYLRARGVRTLGPFRPEEGAPWHGFVAVDPEGYYLELERFNPHPENGALLPRLDRIGPLGPAGGARPPELDVRGTVLWLYYDALPPLERFWERLLGADLLVDQGWAKVYPVSASGFVGLVDEGRGLHEAAPESRVTVGFVTRQVDAWHRRARALGVDVRTPRISEDRPRVRSFLAADPGGYLLEWRTWLPVEENRRLRELLPGA